MQSPENKDDGRAPADDNPVLVNIISGTSNELYFRKHDFDEISPQAFIMLNQNPRILNRKTVGDSDKIVARWDLSQPDDLDFYTSWGHFITHMRIPTEQEMPQELTSLRDRAGIKSSLTSLRDLLGRIGSTVTNGGPKGLSNVIYLLSSAYANVLAVDKNLRTGDIYQDRRLHSLAIWWGNSFSVYGPLNDQYNSSFPPLPGWRREFPRLEELVEAPDYEAFLWPETIGGNAEGSFDPEFYDDGDDDDYYWDV